MPLLGARQNTHCPWWAALDSNQAKLNYQFYRLARYLLRYTDPYYLTLGGSSWTQTRTSIRRRIYRNLLKNPAVKVFIKSRKRNRVSPSAVSINSTNDPYLNISITRGPSPYVHNLRVYSISEETQSELRGATPNFWPQSLDQVSRRNDYLQLSPTIQNLI